VIERSANVVLTRVIASRKPSGPQAEAVEDAVGMDDLVDSRALARAVAILGDEVGLAALLSGLTPSAAEVAADAPSAAEVAADAPSAAEVAADALAAAGLLADQRPLRVRHALLRTAVLAEMPLSETDLLRAEISHLSGDRFRPWASSERATALATRRSRRSGPASAPPDDRNRRDAATRSAAGQPTFAKSCAIGEWETAAVQGLSPASMATRVRRCAAMQLCVMGSVCC
jgi:hypothetical protein